MRTMTSKSLRKAWIIVLGAGAVLGVVYISYNLLRPRTLADDAADFYHAALRGDAAALLPLVSSREREVVGWTEPRLRVVLQKLVQPRLQQLDLVGGSARRRVNHPVHPIQGACDVQVRTPDGRETTWTTLAELEDDGKGHCRVTSLLMNVWQLDYFARHPDAGVDTSAFKRAIVEGYSQDQEVLRSVGFHTHVPQLESEECEAWETMVTRYKAKLAGR